MRLGCQTSKEGIFAINDTATYKVHARAMEETANVGNVSSSNFFLTLARLGVGEVATYNLRGLQDGVSDEAVGNT